MPTATKPCEHCGNPVRLTKQRDLQRKKYCSVGCRQRARFARGELDEQLAKAQAAGKFADKSPRRHRVCASCQGEFLPQGGKQRWCKTCCPNRIARARLQRYNLSQPEFEQLLLEQNFGCAICGEPDPTTIDHDHACCPTSMTCGQCVRGILCVTCNTRLHVIEQEGWVEAALAYLKGVQ